MRETKTVFAFGCLPSGGAGVAGGAVRYLFGAVRRERVVQPPMFFLKTGFRCDMSQYHCTE